VRAGAAARLVVPALLANALLQAALVVDDPVPSTDAWFVAGALASGAAMLATFGVMVATSVTPEGMSAVTTLRAHGLRFAAWSLLVGVAVTLGLLVLAGLPGYLLLALLVYVPIAAMAGPGNPLAVGLRAIRRRPGRWLLGVVVSGLSLLVLTLAAALTWFFVDGPVATVAILVVGGLWAWVLVRLWSRWYLGARPAVAA
jgi:hypothetical protein